MNPFNLPEGSVRAILTLVLVVGLVPVAIWGNEAGLTALAPLAGIAVRDYFAHREAAVIAQGPSVREAVSAEDV